MGFDNTEFVQVKHYDKLKSGEVVIFWRNALYVGMQDRYHVVLYTDGTKQVLSQGNSVRGILFTPCAG